MRTKLNDRDVEFSVEGFGEHGDEMVVIDAVYTDTGDELTDDECQLVHQKCWGDMYQHQYENMACAAHERGEGER